MTRAIKIKDEDHLRSLIRSIMPGTNRLRELADYGYNYLTLEDVKYSKKLTRNKTLLQLADNPVFPYSVYFVTGGIPDIEQEELRLRMDAVLTKCTARKFSRAEMRGAAMFYVLLKDEIAKAGP